MPSAYLRLLIFLPAILIPACASSSSAFLMMHSACKLNKQAENIQPWCTPFLIWNQSVVPCPDLTVASLPAYRLLKRQVRCSGIPISSRIFHSLLWSTQSNALAYKESWAVRNWCFWTVVLEKTLESPLDCKEIQLVYPKGNQSWMFIGRADAEAETLILWAPDAKNWLIGKDRDAGKDWGQEEKGMTEDKMVGWHHRVNGHVLE